MRITLMVLSAGIPLAIGVLMMAGYIRILQPYYPLICLVGIILFHSFKRIGKGKPTSEPSRQNDVGP